MSPAPLPAADVAVVVMAPADADALSEARLADSLARLGAWAASSGASLRLYLGDPAAALVLPAGASVHAQRGDGPGARMLRAVVESAATGARRVLVVGADGPVLPAEVVALAAEALATPRTVVLGPTPSGGCYLIGLNEIAPALFAGEDRHARRFTDALDRALAAGLAPVVLPELPDAEAAQRTG